MSLDPFLLCFNIFLKIFVSAMYYFQHQQHVKFTGSMPCKVQRPLQQKRFIVKLYIQILCYLKWKVTLDELTHCCREPTIHYFWHFVLFIHIEQSCPHFLIIHIGHNPMRENKIDQVVIVGHFIFYFFFLINTYTELMKKLTRKK